MSILPKPHDSMLRAEEEGGCDMISCCRLRRDVCDGANAMVGVEKRAMAAEAWATKVLLMVVAAAVRCLVVFYNLLLVIVRRRMICMRCVEEDDRYLRF